jgi:triphosphoribosyl-dephospho-CoA synthase
MDPGELARIACLWEVNAGKVGNVHRQRDFADLRFADFVQSAAAIAPVLARARERSVGETILEAIQATRRVVQTNTNLGIVLLLAPLAAISEKQKLVEGLECVLDGLSVADSQHVFAAIRLAQPGGLGQASQEDVGTEPTLPLRAIMALAAPRDLVARQYANGYHEVLHEGVPCLHRHLSEGKNLEKAIILTHLDFLAHHTDSLIVRKKGLDVAQEVSRRASAVLAMDEQDRLLALAELDAWLRANRLNPGTSADLLTACLFIALREGIVRNEWWVVSGG